MTANWTPSLSELLARAAASEHGIALLVDDWSAARYLRRLLYAERDRLRRIGTTEFDTLSILIKPAGEVPHREVWIVPRQATARPAPACQSRPLGKHELPDKILARGPARPSIFLRNLLQSPVPATAPPAAHPKKS
jgi:hypothetical protein